MAKDDTRTVVISAKGGKAGPEPAAKVTPGMKGEEETAPAQPDFLIPPGTDFSTEVQEDGMVKVVLSPPKKFKKTGGGSLTGTWKQVTDTTQWPWRAQGACIMKYPGSETLFMASGTMIHNHHVLTAGHNLFDSKLGGWAESIQFTAALNGAVTPYPPVMAVRLVSFSGFVDDDDDDWDMGMIILASDLGKQTGFIRAISTSNQKLANQEVTVAGYPGDKDKQLWTDTDNIYVVYPDIVEYNVCAKPGESGAGAIGQFIGFSDYLQCATQTQGKKPDYCPARGCRVTGAKINRLTEWITTW